MHPGHETHCHKRVPTQSKKVIVDANFRKAEHILPDLGQEYVVLRFLLNDWPCGLGLFEWRSGTNGDSSFYSAVVIA